MKIRADPKKQRFPSLKGIVVVSTSRGLLRVSKWPRKRGPSKSQAVRDQNAWFREANRQAKFVTPTQQARAIELTKQTGLYPRDLLLKQMAGGIFELSLPDGRLLKPRRNFRETKVFQGAQLELNAPFVLVPFTNTIISWPLPILDTAGFWDVTQPSRLTIPAGIDVVEFTAGWTGTGSPPNWRNVIALFRNGAVHSVSDVTSPFTAANTFTHGPLAVVVGDYFEISFGRGSANSAEGDSRTFFTLNVLGAQ